MENTTGTINITGILSENPPGTKKKRSSILKVPTAVLEELDLNCTGGSTKKKVEKRVSFANTHEIKQFVPGSSSEEWSSKEGETEELPSASELCEPVDYRSVSFCKPSSFRKKRAKASRISLSPNSRRRQCFQEQEDVEFREPYVLGNNLDCRTVRNTTLNKYVAAYPIVTPSSPGSVSNLTRIFEGGSEAMMEETSMIEAEITKIFEGNDAMMDETSIVEREVVEMFAPDEGEISMSEDEIAHGQLESEMSLMSDRNAVTSRMSFTENLPQFLEYNNTLPLDSCGNESIQESCNEMQVSMSLCSDEPVADNPDSQGSSVPTSTDLDQSNCMELTACIEDDIQTSLEAVEASQGPKTEDNFEDIMKETCIGDGLIVECAEKSVDFGESEEVDDVSHPSESGSVGSDRDKENDMSFTKPIDQANLGLTSVDGIMMQDCSGSVGSDSDKGNDMSFTKPIDQDNLGLTSVDGIMEDCCYLEQPMEETVIADSSIKQHNSSEMMETMLVGHIIEDSMMSCENVAQDVENDGDESDTVSGHIDGGTLANVTYDVPKQYPAESESKLTCDTSVHVASKDVPDKMSTASQSEVPSEESLGIVSLNSSISSNKTTETVQSNSTLDASNGSMNESQPLERSNIHLMGRLVHSAQLLSQISLNDSGRNKTRAKDDSTMMRKAKKIKKASLNDDASNITVLQGSISMDVEESLTENVKEKDASEIENERSQNLSKTLATSESEIQTAPVLQDSSNTKQYLSELESKLNCDVSVQKLNEVASKVVQDSKVPSEESLDNVSLNSNRSSSYETIEVIQGDSSSHLSNRSMNQSQTSRKANIRLMEKLSRSAHLSQVSLDDSGRSKTRAEDNLVDSATTRKAKKIRKANASDKASSIMSVLQGSMSMDVEESQAENINGKDDSEVENEMSQNLSKTLATSEFKIPTAPALQELSIMNCDMSVYVEDQILDELVPEDVPDKIPTVSQSIAPSEESLGNISMNSNISSSNKAVGSIQGNSILDASNISMNQSQISKQAKIYPMEELVHSTNIKLNDSGRNKTQAEGNPDDSIMTRKAKKIKKASSNDDTSKISVLQGSLSMDVEESLAEDVKGKDASESSQNLSKTLATAEPKIQTAPQDSSNTKQYLTESGSKLNCDLSIHVEDQQLDELASNDVPDKIPTASQSKVPYEESLNNTSLNSTILSSNKTMESIQGNSTLNASNRSLNQSQTSRKANIRPVEKLVRSAHLSQISLNDSGRNKTQAKDNLDDSTRTRKAKKIKKATLNDDTSNISVLQGSKIMDVEESLAEDVKDATKAEHERSQNLSKILVTTKSKIQIAPMPQDSLNTNQYLEECESKLNCDMSVQELDEVASKDVPDKMYTASQTEVPSEESVVNISMNYQQQNMEPIQDNSTLDASNRSMNESQTLRKDNINLLEKPVHSAQISLNDSGRKKTEAKDNLDDSAATRKAKKIKKATPSDKTSSTSVLEGSVSMDVEESQVEDVKAKDANEVEKESNQDASKTLATPQFKIPTAPVPRDSSRSLRKRNNKGITETPKTRIPRPLRSKAPAPLKQLEEEIPQKETELSKTLSKVSLISHGTPKETSVSNTSLLAEEFSNSTLCNTPRTPDSIASKTFQSFFLTPVTPVRELSMMISTLNFTPDPVEKICRPLKSFVRKHNLWDSSKIETNLAQFGFLSDSLHLVVNIGDVITGESFEGDDDESSINRKIERISLNSNSCDSSSMVLQLAHAIVQKRVDTNKLLEQYPTTKCLPQLLKNVSSAVKVAHCFLNDILRISIGHIHNFPEPNKLRVEFVNVVLLTKFSVYFTIDPETYPQASNEPKFEAHIGVPEEKELEYLAAMKNETPGMRYLWRMVDAVEKVMLQAEEVATKDS